MGFSGPLPSHVLALMTPQDRKPLGKAGMTSDEARDKQIEKDEATCQGEIAQYLRLHSIQFIRPDMRKKSPLPEGWPDFTFAYKGVPLALEVKVWGEKPRATQVAMHDALKKDGWRVEVINGVPDVQRIMREIDAIITPTPCVR